MPENKFLDWTTYINMVGLAVIGTMLCVLLIMFLPLTNAPSYTPTVVGIAVAVGYLL